MGRKQNHPSNLAFLLMGLCLILILTACQSENTQNALADRAAATTIPPLPDPTNTATASDPTADTPSETPLPPADLRVYRIIPEESETRFYIDELLFGDPKTVIGRTQDLNGEILLDMDVPGAVEVGPIEINALDLTTDDSFRNRALRSQILESNKDEYQFIFFEPVSIDGLPDQVALGEPVELSMTGELTIRDITSPVTFDLVVTPISETEISGFGSALVLREIFGLEIPKVTGVAEVSQEVRLEIDFVARTE